MTLHNAGAFELYALTSQPVLARDDITLQALIPIFGKRKPIEWRIPKPPGFHHLEMTQCAETYTADGVALRLVSVRSPESRYLSWRTSMAMPMRCRRCRSEMMYCSPSSLVATLV